MVRCDLDSLLNRLLRRNFELVEKNNFRSESGREKKLFEEERGVVTSLLIVHHVLRCWGGGTGDTVVHHRWFVEGKLFVFSVMLTQVVLVRGGGAEKFMAAGFGNTNWLCVVQGAECTWPYGPMDVGVWVWVAVGWCRTNPCLPMICCGWEGGVPADLGVIRTELVGEMLGAKLEALMVGMGM